MVGVRVVAAGPPGGCQAVLSFSLPQSGTASAPRDSTAQEEFGSKGVRILGQSINRKPLFPRALPLQVRSEREGAAQRHLLNWNHILTRAESGVGNSVRNQQRLLAVLSGEPGRGRPRMPHCPHVLLASCPARWPLGPFWFLTHACSCCRHRVPCSVRASLTLYFLPLALGAGQVSPPP